VESCQLGEITFVDLLLSLTVSVVLSSLLLLLFGLLALLFSLFSVASLFPISSFFSVASLFPISSLSSGLAGSLLFFPLFLSFFLKGQLFFFSRITVELDLVMDQFDGWFNLSRIGGRNKFNCLELIHSLNSMFKNFIFRFFIFLFSFSLLFFFYIFVLLGLFGDNHLSPAFDFFLPLFSKFNISRSRSFMSRIHVLEDRSGLETVAVAD
jgi:hypothetical protein